MKRFLISQWKQTSTLCSIWVPKRPKLWKVNWRTSRNQLDASLICSLTCKVRLIYQFSHSFLEASERTKRRHLLAALLSELCKRRAGERSDEGLYWLHCHRNFGGERVKRGKPPLVALSSEFCRRRASEVCRVHIAGVFLIYSCYPQLTMLLQIKCNIEQPEHRLQFRNKLCEFDVKYTDTWLQLRSFASTAFLIFIFSVYFLSKSEVPCVLLHLFFFPDTIFFDTKIAIFRQLYYFPPYFNMGGKSLSLSAFLTVYLPIARVHKIWTILASKVLNNQMIANLP